MTWEDVGTAAYIAVTLVAAFLVAYHQMQQITIRKARRISKRIRQVHEFEKAIRNWNNVKSSTAIGHPLRIEASKRLQAAREALCNEV